MFTVDSTVIDDIVRIFCFGIKFFHLHIHGRQSVITFSCIFGNSTIDGELSSIDELLAKSNLLADFKAVKDGNVWCTGKNLFQETTELGTMIEDIHTILTTDDDSLDELVYMHKLK